MTRPPARRRAGLAALALLPLVGSLLAASAVAAPGASAAVPPPDLLVAEPNDGEIMRVAGEGSGTSVFARVNGVLGTAVGPDGDVYAGTRGGRVLRIPSDGSPVVTVADGLGLVYGVTVTDVGDVYASSFFNDRIYRLPADGGTREVLAVLQQPSALHLDDAGNVLTTDKQSGQALSITPGGVVTQLADGFLFPLSVEQTPDGGYVVAERGRVTAISPDGDRSTLAGVEEPYDTAVDTDGDVYVSDAPNDTVVRVAAGDGTTTVVATGLSLPVGLAIAPTPQRVAIDSTAPADAVVDGPTYTPTATAGASGRPVRFTTTTPDVCSVAAGVVSFIGAGTCTVAADQAGGTVDGVVYTAAPRVTQDVVVAKADQAITFTSTAPTEAEVGDTYIPTATGGDSGNAVTFSIPDASADVCGIGADDLVTFTARGTCTIEADQAGDDDHEPAATTPQLVAVEVAATTLDLDPTTEGLTATVTAPAGAGSPTGDVVFALGDVTLGSATLTAVTGEPRVATAVLDATSDTGASGVLRATYPGDDTTLGGSTDDYTRTAPTVSVDVLEDVQGQSVPAEANAAGWYDSPVTVLTECTAGSADLVDECAPAYRTSGTAPGVELTRTATAADGGRASVTTSLQVDTVTPVLTTRRLGNAPYSRTARPIRCTASDATSGVDGTCTVTYGGTVRGAAGKPRRTWTASVTDVAGNTRTRSNSFLVTRR